MLRKLLFASLTCLILIQFFRPERNESNDNSHALSNAYAVPANINIILTTACADCHSNKTRYPWYANLQPVGWLMAHHITDGKKHLNLSEFTVQSIGSQHHQLEEISKSVESRFMPLYSYTLFGMHPEANLNDAQREQLAAWANHLMDSLEDTHPPGILRRQ